MSDPKLWEGCPNCGCMRLNGYQFERVGHGESSAEMRRTIKQQDLQIQILEQRIELLELQNETLRRTPTRVTSGAPAETPSTFDPIVMPT